MILKIFYHNKRKETDTYDPVIDSKMVNAVIQDKTTKQPPPLLLLSLIQLSVCILYKLLRTEGNHKPLKTIRGGKLTKEKQRYSLYNSR